MNTFFENYRKWEDDCLAEYNEQYGENRILLRDAPEDYNPDDVIEFSEEGEGYPHSIFGIGYIKDCVTPWELSKWYVD